MDFSLLDLVANIKTFLKKSILGPKGLISNKVAISEFGLSMLMLISLIHMFIEVMRYLHDNK